jgi:ribulose-phosphate 3-epimerase
MALIAPSLLAANFARLGEALGILKAAGASMVHVDVMDGHFVPEISVGLPVIESLRKATDLPLEVHLLVERPERFAEQFLKAGTDRLTVHVEATNCLRSLLGRIRASGARAGVAVNPSTPLEAVSEAWEEMDFLNILTAEPGLREQVILPGAAAKIRAAAAARAERRLDFAIQVEGGLTAQNLEEIARVGADILVAGSAIFDNVDPRLQLAQMIRWAAGVRLTSKA